VPDEASSSRTPQPRGGTIIAAGLLLFALAVVVLYTSRGAFLSPVALVVVAAIGVAALLLQFRLRPGVGPPVRAASRRGPLWLNAAGVLFAAIALFADLLPLSGRIMVIASLTAVACFAVSGVILLSALRKIRT